jgi:hypothetical protein
MGGYFKLQGSNVIKVGSIVIYVGHAGKGSRMHGIVLKVLPHEYEIWWYNGITSHVSKRFVQEVA